MTRDSLLKEIEEIFQKELEDSTINIQPDSTPCSIEKWDSINNLVLIAAIEEKYNVTFPIEVIYRIEKVDDIIEYVYQTAQV